MMQIGRRLLTSPQRIDVGTTRQQQSVDAVECTDENITIGYRRNEHRYTACRHHLCVIRFVECGITIVEVCRDTNNWTAFPLWEQRVDAVQF